MRLSEIKPKNIPPPPPRLPMSDEAIAWQRHLSECLKESERELAESKRKANFAIIALSISNVIAICALLYRCFTF